MWLNLCRIVPLNPNQPTNQPSDSRQMALGKPESSESWLQHWHSRRRKGVKNNNCWIGVLLADVT